ncbi:MAG: EthD domain-containing protein [Halioglobus sp.]
MIKLNYFVRKRADVTAEDFRVFWMGNHAEEVLKLVDKLGIRKYTKCETQHEDDVNKLLQQMYGSATDAYDFAEEMLINDLEDFKEGLNDADVQKQLLQLHEDSRAYVDVSRSDIWFSVDIPQVFTGEDCTATPDNTYLKGIYVGSYLPQLSLAEAQLHWNACHGGMARQFIKMLPYKQYSQGHRIESKITDQLKTILGAGFENRERALGQAEAWIDRRIVPSLQGPEVDRMMRMLVTDISLFVEPENSHMFATKEHVILDRPVITEPIPTLFSAD